MTQLPCAGQLFIAGEWKSAASGESLMLENPSNGETIGTVAAAGRDDVDAAVHAAQDALEGAWGSLPAAERGRILLAIGRAVATEVESLARIESTDVGKPLRQARADALALARYLEFYAGAADKLHGETILTSRTTRFTRYANHTASPRISFRGIIRCKSSAGQLSPRWLPVTPRF